MNKEITQENTTIKVTKDTRDKLMIRKINGKLKTIEETIIALLEETSIFRPDPKEAEEYDE
jgi:hypothetical protein